VTVVVVVPSPEFMAAIPHPPPKEKLHMQTLNTANAVTTNPPHRRLGRLLLDGEFVSGGDFAHALDAQQRSTSVQLGQILVELGRLDPAYLKAVLAIQQHTGRLDDALKLAGGVRQRLGELLLAARRITPAQLKSALEAQPQSGKRLGEILIEQRILKPGELDALLKFQHNQTNAAQAVNPLQLGEILVGMGEITRQQLDDALAQQVHTRRKLGELLIEAGHLLHAGLSKALRLQQKLLVAVLIAVLALGSVSPPASALVGVAPPQAGQSLQVSVTVLEVLRLSVLHQTHTITVKAEDVQRGYVDIVAGTNLEILSNALSGFKMQFQLQDSAFKEVEVSGLHNNIVLDGNGASGASLASAAHFERQAFRTNYELSYRFKVPANMSAGVYPFPVQISLANL
jgi:hypothetical protein